MNYKIRIKEIVSPISSLKSQLMLSGKSAFYRLVNDKRYVILVINGIQHNIPFDVVKGKTSFELKGILDVYRVGKYHHPQIKAITDYVSKNWRNWCKGTPISWGINENLNSIEITYKNKVTTTVTRDFNSILFIINNKKQ